MKRNLLFFVTALALLVAAASAQTVKLKAEVPFSFIVNRSSLRSGEYIVESMGDQGIVLRIRNLNSNASNLVISNSCTSLKPTSQTKLVFHRYGNRYFLKQIWIEGNSDGRELPAGPREREVAKDFSKQEVVLVAARH